MVGEVTKCPTCRRLVVRGPQCSCGTIYHRLVTHHHQCWDFESAKFDLKKFLLTVFGLFSWIRVFLIRSGVFRRSVSGLRKKSDPDPDPKHGWPLIQSASENVTGGDAVILVFPTLIPSTPYFSCDTVPLRLSVFFLFFFGVGGFSKEYLIKDLNCTGTVLVPMVR